jgi:membrane fusion protein (multidrug efflux system)
MRRRIIVGLVAVLVFILCAGLIGFNLFRDKMITQFFATMQPPPQTVAATEVKTKRWTPGIPAIGTARATYGVELASQLGGVVRQINIVPGKKFAKGDLLVQLEDAVERADLADAEASLKLADDNLDRSRSLQTKGYTPQASYDQAQAQFASAQARVARLKAVIDQKAISAPFDGVAGISRVDLGQYVNSGMVVTTFQDLSGMKVDFRVPEQFVDRIKMDQPVRVGSSENNMPFKGKIVGIDPRIDPQTRLLPVQALVAENKAESKDETILPGQFLQVRIELPAEDNIVTVPQTAVITSLFGDYVYIVSDDEKDGKKRQISKQAFVKAGRREGGLVEIVSGLKAGQTVVVAGQNKLQSGSVVMVDNSIDVTKIARGEKAQTQ